MNVSGLELAFIAGYLFMFLVGLAVLVVGVASAERRLLEEQHRQAVEELDSDLDDFIAARKAKAERAMRRAGIVPLPVQRPDRAASTPGPDHEEKTRDDRAA